MTNKLEKQFFDTFGIEPKYNDGCEISDRYWANEENADKYITFDNYMNTFCPESDSGACFATCPFAYYKKEYPKITDRILLELICIAMGITDFRASTVDDLKEVVLEVLINGIKYYNSEEIKHQVKALFMENNNDR